MQNSGAALTLVAAAAQNLPVSMTCQNSTPTTVVISQVQTGATNTSQYINSGSSPQVSNMSAQQLQEAEAALESDKRSIYKHPLFPLMALLFEKCEQATQTPDCPSSDGFDVDIQAFVHHQEQDRKPFFSDNPELDNLMVKSIQVLRIHLLELEKVNDLCKDFCSRYITCLKGKLQSENLLRTDMQDMSGSPTLLSSPTQAVQQMQQVLTSVGQGGMVIQNMAQPAMATLNQGQIVSGGTVYQMVQTPQGLVAQPIQIQAQNPLQSGAATTIPVIHGTTPLSQIGVVSTPTNASQTTTVSSSSLPMTPNSPGSDDEGRKNKRGVLPKQATQVMRSWLFQHIVHPYPTEDEKRQIAAQTNLSLLQVNNWFINARRRILQPMLDASNPDLSKVKKNKPQTRPVQRFWPDSIANIQPQPVTSTSQLPTSDSPQQQQPQQSQPQATTVSVSSSQVTVTPQQIIIPAGRIVTADGQIINTTTATTVSIQSLPNDIGGLTPMLQQLQQQQQQQGTPSPGGTLHIKSEGNLSISEEDLGLNHSDEDDDSDLSD